MKKTLNNLWSVLPLVLASLLLIMALFSVGNTKFPESVKYSFNMILGISFAIIVTIFFLHVLKNERSKGKDESAKEWSDAYQKISDEKSKIESETAKTAEELKEKIVELNKKLAAAPVINPAIAGLDNNSLMQKCAFLEQYRNSFPYQVADGYRILAIIKTGVEVSRYSRWMIVGESGNQLFSLDLIRPDNQSYKEMLQLIVSTNTPQEISSFSMHENVWWE